MTMSGLRTCLRIASLVSLLHFQTVLSKGSVRGDDFPTPINTEPSSAQPMTPDEVVRTATVPEGFQLSVFAAEPDVQNPIAITTDERGRLWVAENYTWAGNSLGNYRTDLSDRLVILDDTNGDGKHDKRTVFWDGAKKLTSVEVGFGGVWVIALPHLLFIPDKNRDDVPDGPAQVVLDGINEDSVSHTPANGLRWGPDGWLYARHGILATSSIGAPGAGDSQRIQVNTGVWRYHPVRGTVETVMHGMTNSWGFDYNAAGEMFCINTVIGHLWHVLPGARTERMFGIDANPRAYQLLPQVADHVHWDTGEVWHEVRNGVSDSTLAAGGGHAHIGLMIYQGDNWPAPYRNKLYTLNLHGRRINCDSLERQGAGYVAKHQPDLMSFADPFFRGMDLITGPDGGVFIADWSDTGECHDHDGVHRTSGRIYKLTYGSPQQLPSLDLSNQSNDELIRAQSHPNAWFGRQARRILMERSSVEAVEQRPTINLETSSESAKSLSRLWADHAVGHDDVLSMLLSENEAVRVWGIRFLVEPCSPTSLGLSPQSLHALEKLASENSSGLVDLHLAAALQRLPLNQREVLAERLVQNGEWADDKFYPIMVWLGIEEGVSSNPELAIRLFRQSQIPLVTRNIARRLSESIDTKMEIVDTLVQLGIESLTVEKELRRADEIVLGMSQALAGWSHAPSPSHWKAMVEKMGQPLSAEVRQGMDQLNIVFGDGQAIEMLQTLAANATADPNARCQAILAVAAGKAPGFDATLRDLLGDRAVHQAALQGLVHYDSPETPDRALQQLGLYAPDTRRELVRLLVSRPAYARVLLVAVEAGRLSADEISAFHARQIRSFDDAELTAMLGRLWGDVRPTSEDKATAIKSLRESLQPKSLASASASHGRGLFNKVCANCHVLYGQGHRIGPDLTGSNRQNLDYLLENILDPSASVGNDFRTTVFVLEDGRVMSGVVSAQSDRTLTIQTPDGPSTIDRETISQSKVTSTSLMPEALLQNLSPEEIQNLFAYLMTTSQVPEIPATGAVSAD